MRIRVQLAWRSFGLVGLLMFGNVSQEATAETHKLRGRGRTLIEAEAYSEKSSADSPKAEESDRCSGKHFLGYFWANQWFELEVEVPRLLNYHMSLRASSADGTRLKVQMIDGAGNVSLLATIDVPKTEGYTNYTYVKDTVISLPKGVRKLRFVNLVDGVDIDYIKFTAGSEDDVVSVRPKENAGPDINPLKGFASGWWRENEQHCSVGFQHIEWGQLEPQDDVFDWETVESVASRPGSQGRHLVLQLVADWDDWDVKEPSGDSHYKGPRWLLERVGENRGPAFPDDPNSRILRATDYNDPEFIKEANEAVEAFCDHFRDDPRTFVLQTGVLGFWGEWHTYPRTDWSPTESTKQTILDTYLNNIGRDGLTQVRHPDEAVAMSKKRVGYSNGSATLTEQGYKFAEQVENGQLWKNGPVGGSWPTGAAEEFWGRFFQTGEGKSFLERGHYSTMIPPEIEEIQQRIPDWKPDARFMDMHRRMGYNFQVKAVRHLVAVDDSGLTFLEVDLRNVGVAPFYKNWNVQLAILHAETAEVIDLIDINNDIRELLPAETMTLAGYSRAKLDPRVRYQIGIRILQPNADQPKPTAWGLDARNVYVVLANELDVIKGFWEQSNALRGGWNILGFVEQLQPDRVPMIQGRFFPLEGAFRPVEDDNARPSQN